jgi:hypothetical protein
MAEEVTPPMSSGARGGSVRNASRSAANARASAPKDSKGGGMNPGRG